jgi:hypothetical protein
MLVEFLSIFSTFIGLLFGFLALFSDNQIREIIVFRAGNEETGSFIPVVKTDGDVFPVLRLDPAIPSADVVKVIGSPFLSFALLIGLLCIGLVIWILFKRILDH